MQKYTVITRNRIGENSPEEIFEEQMEKRTILGLNGSSYLCHFFESEFFEERTEEMSVDVALECLAIKDGADLVQYENGNYGFVAFYNGRQNGFEIIG
mgnify:CR=1 FL=1